MTPLNADNEHLFLAKSTNSQRKPSNHYQLSCIDLSFLKVKNPSFESTSVFPALHTPGGGGGHLGIFWVGMCRPGIQIGTPF